MFPTIQSLSDWGRIFQSIECFEGIIADIAAREGRSAGPVSNLTPGTNAVFRVGDEVWKIFAPKESGIDPVKVFPLEVEATRAAADSGIHAPRILGSGMVTHRYDFYYIIMEYLDAREAGDCIDEMNAASRMEFGRQMRNVMDKLRRMRVGSAPRDVYSRAMENDRWHAFGDDFLRERRERITRIAGVYSGKETYVHGDLTGENVLLTSQGEICIIDFADGCMAPPLYEYAPLFHELFRCDAIPMRALLELPDAEIADQIAKAILLHDFGADMATHLLSDMGIPPSHAAVEDLHEAIRRRFGMR